MSEILFNLKLDADSSALEKKIKSLSKKLGFDVEANTEKATQNLKKLQNTFNSLKATQEDYSDDALRSAREQTKALEKQTRATEKLAKSAKKAQETLSRKTADLDVAKARVAVLEEQVSLTRKLASEGLKTEAQLNVKVAQVAKAKERVKTLNQEVSGLRQAAKSYKIANKFAGDYNNQLDRARKKLAGLQAANKKAATSGNNLLGAFAKFSVVNSLIDRAVDAILELPGAILSATLELEKLNQQLDFGTSGEGAKKLEELFDLSQKLGVSFTEMSRGYAQFAASVKGSDLEQETDAIFTSFSKAASALKLSGEDAQGVFVALSQIASKGVVSMEEFRQQLGERLPIATQAGVKALQMLVDEGTVPLTSINKSLTSATEETRKAYQVTTGDLNNYIASGKALSEDFLPALGKAIEDNLGEVNTEGLQQSINRAQNSLIKLGAAIGQSLAPTLTAIFEKVTEIVDFILKKSGEIFASFKPFILAGQSVLLVLAAIDAAFKALTGNGAIEVLISLLDELAIALAVVFGGAILSAIGAVATALAPIVGAVAAIVVGLKVLEVVLKFVFKILNDLTGGRIGKFFVGLGSTIKDTTAKLLKFGKQAESSAKAGESLGAALSKVNDEVERANSGEGAALGGAFSSLFGGEVEEASENLARFTSELIGLQNAVKDIDYSELVNITNIEKQIAEGTLSASDAVSAKLESSIEANKARLENAVKTYENAVAGIEAGVEGNARADLVKAREKSLNEIQQLEQQLAKQTVEIRKQAVEAQLDVIRKSGDQLKQETTKAELERVAAIRELADAGNVNVEAANEERIALTEARIQKEIQLETDRITTLQSLADGATEGSELQLGLLDQIIEAEQKRSDLISQQAQVEIERQQALERQTEAKILDLETDQAQLETAAKLAQIKNESLQTQNTLTQAQFDLAQAQLGLEQTLAQSELDRLNYAVEANQLLLQVDESRRDAVAERLGIDASVDEVALAEQRKQQEELIYEQKLKQLELQQQAEQAQLKFERGQVKFQAAQERSRVKAAQIEAKIAKLKAEQAISSALVARSAALAAGDTERAAQAELEILQARQQLDLVSEQQSVIQAELQAITEQERLQNNILETRGQILEQTQEQQRTELDLSRIADQRAEALRAEQELLAETVRQRELERDQRKAGLEQSKLEQESVIRTLRYGSEQQQQSAELLASRTALNKLQAEYEEQLAHVAYLEAEQSQTAEQQLILTEAQNDLRQLGLDILDAEYEIESRLANEVARQREQALQRQVDILQQRKSLLEAEVGLASAQSDLAKVKLEGELIGVDEDVALKGLSDSEADERRAEIRLEILDLEQKALERQQEVDQERLRIEQEIELSRLRATQAEAEVTKARAEVARSEAQNALARALETGDEDAIDIAQSAIEAAESGVQAAQEQIELLDEQIELAMELQEIARETQETQQEADRQRLANRERELELAREIAALESSGSGNSGFRVTGGGVSAGKTYTVGEQGTELFKGTDGSTRLLGVTGQHTFTPNVPGSIIPNNRLEQHIAANIMRADSAVVKAIQNGFKSSGQDFARLAGVLVNRTAKPVTVNNYSPAAPNFDSNKARLGSL